MHPLSLRFCATSLADIVAGHMDNAAISAVNLQEVAKEMLREGATTSDVRVILDELALDVRAHDAEAAYISAELYEQTNTYGRGLGDRSCMALGLQLELPVLTTDREWKKIKIKGLQLQHVR
jgi:ribonuclease VapC